MKKKVTIVLVIISIVAISIMIMFSIYKSSEACRKANAAIQWDCSVTCADRNDFDIIVHLLCEGKQELVSGSIPAGGCYSFLNVTDEEYTVGIHADVDENTDIKVFVYDGKDTESYTR